MRTQPPSARLPATSAYLGLSEVAGFPFPVWASPGAEERAGELARRGQAAYGFLAERLGRRPDVILLALAAEDWPRFSGAPFGMPGYANGHLILPGTATEFGAGLARLLGLASPELRRQAREVYGGPDGRLELDPFFSLLSVHELGHAFQRTVPLRFPRRWLDELFGNVCLHCYIAEADQAALPVLETFPLAFETIDPHRFRHRSLGDFERLYLGVGAENYAWYQCRLHVLAKRLYDADGVVPLHRLWDRFLVSGDGQNPNDDELVTILGDEVHPVLGDAVVSWPS